MNKKLLHLAVLGSMLASTHVDAVEFDGFLTAGLAVHDQKEVTYLDGITKDISFDNDSKFGLQVTAEVAEDMQAVAQILARGSNENYDLDVAWAYLDYRLANGLNLRGGKVKEPVFLISDYFEVGYAYPWIRPPQEVYRNNPINTINGIQLQYTTSIKGLNFLVQPYLGTNTDDVPGTGGQAQFFAERFWGAAMQLSNPSVTLQLSFLKVDVSTSGLVPLVDTTGDGNPDAPFLGGGSTGEVSTMNVTSEGKGDLVSLGLSWDVSSFVGYAEIVQRGVTGDQPTAQGDPLSAEALFPDQDAYYVTLGYRIAKFLPHVTFAHSEAEPLAGTMAQMTAVVQDSITLGLRYELNDSAALKMEFQRIELDKESLSTGDNGLYSDATTPFGVMPEDESSMVSVAIDVIF